MLRLTVFAAAASAAALLSGCAPSPPAIVPAEAVVRLDGQPLPRAAVQFVPVAPGVGAEYIATGTTDEQGRATLTCKGQPGAAACETIVLVTEAPMPGDLRGNQGAEARYWAGLKNRPIPGRYFNTTKNPLTLTVTAGQAEYTLDLTR